MEKEELELLEGFRRLCPVDRNTIMTAVTIAISAEQAVKRQYGLEAEAARGEGAA
jgi:hypothetical protein